MNIQREIAEASDTIQQYIDYRCDEAREEVHRQTVTRLAALILADYSRNWRDLPKGGAIQYLVRAYA